MKKCMLCGGEIHPKRLEILPSTQTCVTCSTTGRKAGVTVTLGEGDHTYNETIIMEQEEYLKYKEFEHKFYGKRKDDIPHPEDETVEEEEEIEDELDGIEEVKNIDTDDLEDNV